MFKYGGFNSDLDNLQQLNHNQARLQIMMQYIQEHYAEEITLEMIAASASISKSGALHIFQSGIHCSPVAYLIQYRLAQVQRNTERKKRKKVLKVCFITTHYKKRVL